MGISNGPNLHNTSYKISEESINPTTKTKPFNKINGSGKHCNWSLNYVDETGKNVTNTSRVEDVNTDDEYEDPPVDINTDEEVEPEQEKTQSTELEGKEVNTESVEESKSESNEPMNADDDLEYMDESGEEMKGEEHVVTKEGSKEN